MPGISDLKSGSFFMEIPVFLLICSEGGPLLSPQPLAHPWAHVLAKGMQRGTVDILSLYPDGSATPVHFMIIGSTVHMLYLHCYIN